MSLKVATKGKKMNEVGGSGYADDWPEVGHYQFLVTGIEVQPEKLKNMIIITLETITGEVPGQEGKKPDFLLWYDPSHEKWGENAMDRITRFFWAVGLVKDDEEVDLEPSDAIGRCFIGKVVKAMRKKSKDDPTKVEVIQMEDGAMWPIGHDDVKALFEVDEKIAKDAEAKPVTEAASGETDEDLKDL